MKRINLDELIHFIIVCVYTLFPPFYMMALTYLLATYRGVDHFIISDIIPVFWKTVWIPALCSFITYFLLQLKKNHQAEQPKRVKDYPLVFIFFYSVYFMILGQVSWGSDCMYGGISGMLLVFFAWVFYDNLKKCVIYLPMSEKVYAFMVVFLFPVFVLVTTDIVSLMREDIFRMSVLIAPVIYVGGISCFLLGCIVLRLWCVYYKMALKKHAYTLQQLIMLSLIGSNAMFLYLTSYLGDTVILVGLMMSVLLVLIEYLYKWKRYLKK